MKLQLVLTGSSQVAVSESFKKTRTFSVPASPLDLVLHWITVSVELITVHSVVPIMTLLSVGIVEKALALPVIVTRVPP